MIDFAEYEVISIVFRPLFEFRLCTCVKIHEDIRPYIIIKHLYKTNKSHHINSFMTPITKQMAIDLFFKMYL